MPLQPGDQAPDFTLPDQTGEEVALSSFKGRKVLVYSYPGASTPGAQLAFAGRVPGALPVEQMLAIV